jgi:hypothetical protein
MTEKRNSNTWMAQNRPLATYCSVTTGLGSMGTITSATIEAAIGKAPSFVRLTVSGNEGWLVYVDAFHPATMPVSAVPADTAGSGPEGGQAVVQGESLIIDMANVTDLTVAAFAVSRSFITIACW